MSQHADELPSPVHALWREFSANRGAVIALALLLAAILIAILAPWVAPHSPIEQFRDHMLQAPAWQTGDMRFLLGTDETGRDILSRLIHGGRISLLIAIASVLLAMLPGVALGLVAAFFPARVGFIIMRVMDTMLALPSLLLAICIITILGPGLVNTVLAIAIGSLPAYTRLARASAIAEINKDYVIASRLAGASTARLMFNVVLPNCMAPLIINATLGFSTAILEAAALGFLGLGVQPPTPEWGSMLANARDYMERAPWVVTMPGITVLLVVLAINLLGDGLRDALDPRQQK